MKHEYLVVLRVTAESKGAAGKLAAKGGKVEKIYEAASTTLPSEEIVAAAIEPVLRGIADELDPILQEGPANHIRAVVSGPGWKIEFER